ncbi:MAG TPA: cell division protein ZipA C-terminal FtsZ-binding domain-containing protein [Burkholderiales bacterium]|nr:cell division protein ZipA C-terminal FtsZ-binding domain-containing protein [Burkholderiales bacterium]
MSDLQLALLAAGVAVVGAVLAYNKWQELQYRRRAEAIFRAEREDVLLRAGAALAEPAAGRAEPFVPAAHGGAETGPAPAAPAAAVLSETLDCIVTLESSEGLAGDAVLAAVDGVRHRCSKAVSWEGVHEDASRWEPLRADRGYSTLRAGLQLVDRRGAVTAEELETFASGVHDAAAGLGARAQVPDTRAALARAADLDRFCGDVDICIALNVVSATAAFPGARIRSLAEAAGLALEPDGAFRRRDGSGRLLYELGNLEPAGFDAGNLKALTTRGLTLQLDVPRAPGGERTFVQFADFAQQLARALGANIVDDNRKALGAASFDAIRIQLRGVYKSMESRGIDAGGALALRLFS